MASFQFYDTAVLLTDDDTERTAWMQYVSVPLSPFDTEARDRLVRDLMSDAPRALAFGLESLIAVTSGLLLSARRGESGYWPLTPDQWWEGWPLFEESPTQETVVRLRLAHQAVGLAVVPTENSPLQKRTLTDLATQAGRVGVYFFVGVSPILILVTEGGLLCVRALGSAMWEGARPEAVEFGADAGEAVFGALRRRLGIKRRTDS